MHRICGGYPPAEREAALKKKDLKILFIGSSHPSSNDMPLMADSLTESASDDRYDMNLEPDDIEVSDTVTVIWEI